MDGNYLGRYLLKSNRQFTPTMQVADAILARKAIAAEAVKRVVELAAELVGGPGFIDIEKNHVLRAWSECNGFAS
jgi:hypothetical protein